MNSQTLFILILLALALLVVIAVVAFLSLLLWLTIREFRKWQGDRKEVDLANIQLHSKLVGLLAAQDTMAYQGIQVMDQNLSMEDSTTSESKERTIDELLEQAQYSQDSLTEAEIERLNEYFADVGGPVVR